MKRYDRSRILVAVALGATLAVAAGVPARARTPELFTLEDPRGDDHGDGTISYPIGSGLRPGDLDIVELTAREVPEGIQLEVVFARKVKPADRRTIDSVGTTLDSVARFGFYTFNLDIYIDQDGIEGSGNLSMLPGRNADVEPSVAWERAVVLTPRPFEARAQLKGILSRYAKLRLRDTQTRVDPEEVREVKEEVSSDVESLVYFPTQIQVRGRSVRFLVPTSFLGGRPNEGWRYVVAVSASDLFSSLDLSGKLGGNPSHDALMILPVRAGSAQDALGSTRDYTELLAPLLDILVPEEVEQKEVLSNYDLQSGRRVAIPGVSPAAGR